MAITVRDTSLHASAFWILDVTVRDDRQAIVRRAEDRSLEFDHAVCQAARSQLTNPRTRLSAEIAWLPGVSPNKSKQLATRILQDPNAIRSESGLPALAHANLMAAAFETLDGSVPPAEMSVFLQDIASFVERLDVEEVRRDINEDRAVSGFPEIASDEQIQSELVERKQAIRNVVKDALNRLPTDTIVQVMTDVVETATYSGESHAPELIDDLVDSYEVEAHEFLEKEAANVAKLVQAAREVAKRDSQSVDRILDGIERVVRNWDRVAQPIQVSAKARGIAHGPSNEMAFELRDLAIDLFNEHDLATESKRLTDLLKEVFAEVPLLAERAEQDADALESIIENRQEWTREISYQAEVGIAFKNTLSISPAGISWKGMTYPLNEITRVRWGGVKHSVNGIPTGTTYTIAFGDEQSESVVELRREEVFSTFVEKLWRAVGARLVTELVASLKSGTQLTFGDAVVKDDCVILRKHKWLGSDERVRCSWHEVHVWTADGSFCIGAQNDKKTYAALSYIHLPNVHILEQVIRVGFKRGIHQLSDILQSE